MPMKRFKPEQIVILLRHVLEDSPFAHRFGNANHPALEPCGTADRKLPDQALSVAVSCESASTGYLNAFK